MAEISETLAGIVQRVTYHNPDNGWSVLRLSPFNRPGAVETVTVHQTQVFAGATMEFSGAWTMHPKFGRQFRALEARVKKPASSAALEKYLGSGLIKGVGPKTARRIVSHFGSRTLEIFEEDLARLTEVPGIAKKKLKMIEQAWAHHKAVREVMMFLQGHGISTLFAVRIYKQYGDKAIAIVQENPYRLASDFYGIGFFSADKVAMSLGFAPDGKKRLAAAIAHVLSAAREQGHCYLEAEQIESQVDTLLGLACQSAIPQVLAELEAKGAIRQRDLSAAGKSICYYDKGLYYDETFVATRLKKLAAAERADATGIDQMVDSCCRKKELVLSEEQQRAVSQVVLQAVSVLTGGPGCGKTTTTLMIVRVLELLGKKTLLAAPTGRAAQRMSEVIGREAKTIHRLLQWQRGGFAKNEEDPLEADFLIVDESSMLDVSLCASLLRAVPHGCQLLLIGDSDQLPSVGPGNILRDIIASNAIPVYVLRQVFRQARQSKIISYAHQINGGRLPRIESPFRRPKSWQNGEDCLFIDSDEATGEQLSFIARAKRFIELCGEDFAEMVGEDALYEFRSSELITSAYERDFTIPEKFAHVDLDRLQRARGPIEELRAVVGKVHPFSTLHYGFSAVTAVVRLYREWIPRYYGDNTEIQILSPMTRGSLGTHNLNQTIQEAVNPRAEGKPEILIGERVLRKGDRVIHRRNNYDLGVFNGDIGWIEAIDNAQLSAVVRFSPDEREVEYQKEALAELDLAYAITIHKAQGSEFEAVILPVFTQHFKMLFQNLIYTGLTRAKKLAVLTGSRKALAMAVRREDTASRQTALQYLLAG